MKRLFFLGACLVALVSQPVMAQAGGTDIVVVRLSGGRGVALVVRPGGKVTTYPLNGYGIVKAQTQDCQTVQTILTTLYQEGYELKNTYSEGGSPTLILTRPKQQ